MGGKPFNGASRGSEVRNRTLLRRRFANAAEILKRVINFDVPPLTDEDLVLNAEELFLALDEQEAD
ncbi:hypothetical protein POG23_08970, partial [Limnoraphis robusta]|nr:hypothetical protein [Limnoraphis robusta]